MSELHGASVGGMAALFGHRHEARVHEWAEREILNSGIALMAHPANAEQFKIVTTIMRWHCERDVFASPST
jgi:hypothetical protein